MTTLYTSRSETADGQRVEIDAKANGPHTNVWLRFGGIGDGHSVRLSRADALTLACDLLDAYKAVKSHNNQQQKVGTET